MPSSKGWGGRRDGGSEASLGEVLDGLLLERPFARGLPIARLSLAWPSLVGPRLAAASAPASLEGGVLVITASSGPWGAQVRFLAEEIRVKVNEALGEDAVRRVQVVVVPDRQEGL
jgi:predicted nucleic acid-binding Zn ribbon protein